MTVPTVPHVPPVPKTSVLVLDCSDPEPLARFYAALLDAVVEPAEGDPDLLLVSGGSGAVLGIRRDLGHAPPSWPRPEDSLQAHLEILVAPDALDDAEREAVSLGARPVAAEREGTRSDRRTDLRRYMDPAGHSFVLVTAAPARTPSPAREDERAAARTPTGTPPLP
ncbi:VOC family protein [Streptomyces sp. NPDC056049]|uniref:VOC family protein n=1 Tax=Streptomyces sp. NPDC056049 TaxID=3345693 RepID=UPI0035E178D9